MRIAKMPLKNSHKKPSLTLQNRFANLEDQPFDPSDNFSLDDSSIKELPAEVEGEVFKPSNVSNLNDKEFTDSKKTRKRKKKLNKITEADKNKVLEQLHKGNSQQHSTKTQTNKQETHDDTSTLKPDLTPDSTITDDTTQSTNDEIPTNTELTEIHTATNESTNTTITEQNQKYERTTQNSENLQGNTQNCTMKKTFFKIDHLTERENTNQNISGKNQKNSEKSANLVHIRSFGTHGALSDDLQVLS